ncbi:permease YjgP/YjgQ family protein [Emticicia oligotrophica DSM 17448]|uniref:Permease YjgP/YjgQ family protein n=1 Tax=Emticicia oligotrophica (strain DSM 17448 / CIP 109782 / MTCC 6937 / GPTSA100-15) TaxID=929562 RepID=A0ABN4AS63_EMTOG|nr:LptF/LptG family permease [Emticicia oligotrophica]AFK05304.1 permease YjgP/YjgQ family protein [Emticicia oligotrophica DSM 17448]
MKKIDILVIRSFIGPFILTTCVVVFIFLMRFLMLYFNDFVGKDLGYDVFGKLFVYFSLITVPIALPLSTLLASLMCFGNLGEYSELTAIKSAGVPISRVLFPAMIFALGVSVFSFWFNNTVNPWANLKGYSLLYDVKTTKVTLNIKEGIFYKEIPGYSIKVVKKFSDGKTLKGVTIYNHSQNNGNINVTLADSGKMYTMYDNTYLVFELFNGCNYIDYRSNDASYNETQFVKNGFKQNKMVFSLESFGMKRTDESQFKYHEFMKNINQLNEQADSIKKDIKKTLRSQTTLATNLYNFQFKEYPVDTSKAARERKPIKSGSWIAEKMKKSVTVTSDEEAFETALNQAKNLKDQFNTTVDIIKSKKRDAIKAEVEKWHKFTMAFACFVMFLIGSSLGSIIKKGGFGMPVLLSITFFILMYVLMQLGDKYAKEDIWPVLLGVWMPDFILLLFGVYFLYKATNDARLFESDIYAVYFDKLKSLWNERKFFKPKKVLT